MDNQKTVEDLDQLFAAGDAWLRKFGIVSPIAHNAVVLNLYAAFPKVKYLEYFLPEDGSRRKVWVILYVPLLKLLFVNRNKMVDDVIEFLKEYLHDYDIQVELKRYKKGIERSNEVPGKATAHLATSEPSSDDEQPKGDVSSGSPGSEAESDSSGEPSDSSTEPQDLG